MSAPTDIRTSSVSSRHMFPYFCTSRLIPLSTAPQKHTSTPSTRLFIATPTVPATKKCVEGLIEQKNVTSESRNLSVGNSFEPTGFLQIFSPICQLLIQCLSTFDKAMVEHPTSAPLIETLENKFSSELLWPMFIQRTIRDQHSSKFAFTTPKSTCS